MSLHLWFDLLAYGLAGVLTWWVRQRLAPEVVSPLPRSLRTGYLVAVTHGVVIGGVAFGTLNLALSGHGAVLGKSILGALVGGIVAVEAFKALRGVRGSTGVLLVPGLCLGIIVGRIGCQFAGLEDHTYGVGSHLPWAVDLGDGVPRHPVPLYEALAMIPLLVLSLWATARRHPGWLSHGFYLFALYYAVQRFAWEFLKPYAPLALGLNLFHWLALALAGYALYMLRPRARALAAA